MNNVVNLQTNYDQELTPSTKFWALKKIHQEWFDRFTPSEYMVLMFIWNRTIFWGKQSEFIYFRHFTEGIPNVIKPLPFKKARLSQIIKSLQERGVKEPKKPKFGEVKTGFYHPYELEVSKHYQLAKRAVVMPHYNPVDPLAAIRAQKHIPPMGSIKILATNGQKDDRWYKVEGYDQSENFVAQGWVNYIGIEVYGVYLEPDE